MTENIEIITLDDEEETIISDEDEIVIDDDVIIIMEQEPEIQVLSVIERQPEQLTGRGILGVQEEGVDRDEDEIRINRQQSSQKKEKEAKDTEIGSDEEPMLPNVTEKGDTENQTEDNKMTKCQPVSETKSLSKEEFEELRLKCLAALEEFEAELEAEEAQLETVECALKAEAENATTSQKNKPVIQDLESQQIQPDIITSCASIKPSSPNEKCRAALKELEDELEAEEPELQAEEVQGEPVEAALKADTAPSQEDKPIILESQQIQPDIVTNCGSIKHEEPSSLNENVCTTTNEEVEEISEIGSDVKPLTPNATEQKCIDWSSVDNRMNREELEECLAELIAEEEATATKTKQDDIEDVVIIEGSSQESQMEWSRFYPQFDLLRNRKRRRQEQPRIQQQHKLLTGTGGDFRQMYSRGYVNESMLDAEQERVERFKKEVLIRNQHQDRKEDEDSDDEIFTNLLMSTPKRNKLYTASEIRVYNEEQKSKKYV